MTAEGSPLPDWARAHGGTIIEAAIRSKPSDFIVDETLGFEAAGAGEHDLLRIEKTNANTDWLARRLAGFAGVKPVDVGYAGLKDRYAVTTQWFSVRRPNRDGTNWPGFEAEGVRILDVHRHDRKLRRGSHAANSFRIALRGGGFSAKRAELEARVEAVSSMGVPNYFGPQRFGRQGRNVELAKRLAAGKRLRRNERSYAISTARSLIFNAILDRRVREGSWNRLCAGDRVNLDGTNSVFDANEVTDDLVARCSALDIHPTATLWGSGAPLTAGQAATLESEVAGEYRYLADSPSINKARASSRALRMRVDELSVHVAEQVVWLEFRLPAGGFATAVLREMASGDGL